MMKSPTRKTDHGRFDFFAIAPLMGGISVLAMVLSMAFILTKGFNYGIDFAGGNEIQVKFAQKVTIDDLQKITTGVGFKNVSIQAFDEESNEYLVRTEAVQAATEREAGEALAGMISKLEDEFRTNLQLPEDGIRRVDTVGPQIGNELKRNGLLAAFYSFMVILLYVAMRFDYNYAPGAVLCLVHDALLTLGVFSVLGREMNVQIMAAILTLIGYSLNDTIVTFDRIRETIPQYREKGMRFVINRAINDTLGRTLLTAGSTMLAVLALWIWGGGVIADLAFTLAIGIVVGVYSSLYIAAPLVLVMDKLNKTSA